MMMIYCRLFCDRSDGSVSAIEKINIGNVLVIYFLLLLDIYYILYIIFIIHIQGVVKA